MADAIELADTLRRDSGRDVVTSDQWQGRYDEALRAALVSGDARCVAAVVSVAVNRLDARGRLGEAVSTLDATLAIVPEGRADARLALLSAKAPFERVQGDAAGAAAALQAAAALASRVDDPFAVREYELARAVCAMSDLSAEGSRVERAIADALARGVFPEAGLLLSWYGALCLARGSLRHARPWIDVLIAEAEAAGHLWRQADAGSLRDASHTRTYRGFGTDPETDPGNNWIARRRLTLLRLYRVVTTGELTHAATLLENLEAQRGLVGVYRDTAPFAAIVAARRGSSIVELDPPTYVGLENLGAILAGAEAVALSGSLALARRWHEWLAERLPATAQSSAEWPASRSRVAGLLALRAGDVLSARRHLIVAIEQCDAEHYEVEGDLAAVQLAELTRSPTRSSVWERLQSAGLDPASVAYWVARSLRSSSVRDDHGLTYREVEVIAALADGRRPADIASGLGISVRTVSNHVQRVYEKLDAHTRNEAIKRARVLGLV